MALSHGLRVVRTAVVLYDVLGAVARSSGGAKWCYRGESRFPTHQGVVPTLALDGRGKIGGDVELGAALSTIIAGGEFTPYLVYHVMLGAGGSLSPFASIPVDWMIRGPGRPWELAIRLNLGVTGTLNYAADNAASLSVAVGPQVYDAVGEDLFFGKDLPLLIGISNVTHLPIANNFSLWWANQAVLWHMSQFQVSSGVFVSPVR